MAELLTIDEAAQRLRKNGRWLRDWLHDHPPPAGDPPYYLQAGRDRLFSERHIKRIEARIRQDEAKAPVPRQFLPGHIYFIEVQGFVKIGWAADVKARLVGIQVACPFEIELLGVSLGTMKDEKALHARFAEHRERGEWFRSTPRLRREIKALTNHHVTRECR